MATKQKASTTAAQKLEEMTETSEPRVKEIYEQARLAARRLRKTSLKHRLEAVEHLIDYINEHKEDIADIICQETRKSRSDAMISEVLGVLDNFEWLVHNAEKLLADKKVPTPITLMGKKSRIFHEPLGTVLVIAPWNYPFHIGLTSILAGFVTGNAVVFKPSEVTPMKGLFEKIFAVDPLVEQSVFIAYGTGKTAQRLIAEKPAKIFFTGSARTGKRILNQAADLMIPVDLELGGKDQAIVFDDVNLDRAVAGVMWGALTNAGQSCSSVERIYVQEGIYDEFVARLKEQVNTLVVNSGDSGNADIGGMTVDFQLDIVRRQVEDAREKGATILTGGSVLQDNELFYLPTVITDVTDDMAVLKEETFGPLLPVMKFKTEEEIIERSNDTEFGLSASVWSKDGKRAERVARQLECGAVSINNVMLTEANPWLPFGGTKASGYGRQKGEEGLLGYTRSKSVLIDADSGKLEPNWYPYTQKKYNLFIDLINSLFVKSPWKLLKLAMVGMKLESEAKKKRQ
ncbi:MAG: aldehyde dehydrogenase family protein [Ketobacteraceae bacterium]|nr:aldehyde dehydrogenase family protein [Ketobacteraceae bacterium]